MPEFRLGAEETKLSGGVIPKELATLEVGTEFFDEDCSINPIEDFENDVLKKPMYDIDEFNIDVEVGREFIRIDSVEFMFEDLDGLTDSEEATAAVRALIPENVAEVVLEIADKTLLLEIADKGMLEVADEIPEVEETVVKSEEMTEIEVVEGVRNRLKLRIILNRVLEEDTAEGTAAITVSTLNPDTVVVEESDLSQVEVVVVVVLGTSIKTVSVNCPVTVVRVVAPDQ